MASMLDGKTTVTYTTKIQPQWMRWIAENALRGITAGKIIEIMVENGIERDTAEAEVIVAMNHPYMEAAVNALNRLAEAKAADEVATETPAVPGTPAS